jgi:hypothetical protein
MLHPDGNVVAIYLEPSGWHRRNGKYTATTSPSGHNAIGRFKSKIVKPSAHKTASYEITLPPYYNPQYPHN